MLVHIALRIVVVVVVVVVLTLTRTIKSVVTGQAPVTLELRNTAGNNTHNPKWYTHISQLTPCRSSACLVQIWQTTARYNTDDSASATAGTTSITSTETQ